MYKIIPYHPLYRDEIIELRNKYIDYLRQPFPLKVIDQCKWEENTRDIYFISLEPIELYKERFKGVAGLTNIDLVNRKAELSLITLDYLQKDIADELLDFIENYAFNKLSLHKLFITAYDFDIDKNQYFKDRYKYQYTMHDNVFYDGSYYDEHCYSLFKHYNYKGGK